ncbi:HAD family hydrolase [Patescibacteria group bacterium]|nr:HAD family hydrolase [Patescibacteria group bacterium]
MKYLLLDRDGTINIEKEYLSNPDQLEFCTGAVDGLKKLSDAGYIFFIVTNQSGIGHGIFTREDFNKCMNRLYEMLDKEGIKIESAEFCPHHRGQQCNCRKPMIGMWESLKQKYPELEPKECVMVGDKDTDVILGKNIGCTTFRILSKKWPNEERGDYLVEGLNEVADILLNL